MSVSDQSLDLIELLSTKESTGAIDNWIGHLKILDDPIAATKFLFKLNFDTPNNLNSFIKK